MTIRRVTTWPHHFLSQHNNENPICFCESIEQWIQISSQKQTSQLHSPDRWERTMHNTTEWGHYFWPNIKYFDIHMEQLWIDFKPKLKTSKLLQNATGNLNDLVVGDELSMKHKGVMHEIENDKTRHYWNRNFHVDDC